MPVNNKTLKYRSGNYNLNPNKWYKLASKKFLNLDVKLQKRVTLFSFVFIFAIIGIVLLMTSHADSPSPFATINANTGTLSGNACEGTDSTASNGKTVVFGGTCSTVSLPSGVTLVAIDGDKLNSAGTANASPGYYCSSAYGTTVSPSNNNACLDGWDNANFFPIGPYWSAYSPSEWNSEGWNTAWLVNSPSDLTSLTNNGLSVILTTENTSGNVPGCSITACTPTSRVVGLETYDEPNTWAEANGGISGTPNNEQDGRFWYVNNTWSMQEYGSTPSGVPGGSTSTTQSAEFTDLVASPNGNDRHLDIGSIDLYWFALATTGLTYNSLDEGGDLYNGSGAITVAEADCGCRYGDELRPVYGTTVGLPASESQSGWHITNPSPLFQIVEDGDAFVNDGTPAVITPPELNWAVWSSIIHGARGIDYFDHGGCPAGQENEDQYAQSSCATSVQSGQSVSIDQQMTTTDSQVQSFSPMINSPIALSFATVSPAPTTFGGVETRSVFDTNSSDCNGSSSCFYIFADTRDALPSNGGPSNINATFKLAGHYSGNIPVATQCGTGATSNGTLVDSSNQFTDTFANAACTKVYGPIPNL